MTKKLSYIDDKMTFSIVMKVSKKLKFLYVSWQGIPPISGFVLKEQLRKRCSPCIWFPNCIGGRSGIPLEKR